MFDIILAHQQQTQNLGNGVESKLKIISTLKINDHEKLITLRSHDLFNTVKVHRRSYKPAVNKLR